MPICLQRFQYQWNQNKKVDRSISFTLSYIHPMTCLCFLFFLMLMWLFDFIFSAMFVFRLFTPIWLFVIECRWVLCANHMEPVKGFLGRYLRRKLVEYEISHNARNNDLIKMVDWMPKVWLHLNKFLETHSSSDVTIGPRLFLSCPIDLAGSQVWFTDLWNYSIVPYLLEAVREGLQVSSFKIHQWVHEAKQWVASQPGVQLTSLNKYRFNCL